MRKILGDDHYRKFSEILVNYKQVCSLAIAIVIFFFLCTRLELRWENFSLSFIVRSYFFQRRELGGLIEGLKKLFLRSEEQYPLFLGMLSSLSCGILEMHFEESILPLLFGCYELHLTNGPQFSMVYTLTDHRNDVIKCSKFKCNLELQTSSFTAKF